MNISITRKTRRSQNRIVDVNKIELKILSGEIDDAARPK